MNEIQISILYASYFTMFIDTKLRNWEKLQKKSANFPQLRGKLAADDSPISIAPKFIGRILKTYNSASGEKSVWQHAPPNFWQLIPQGAFRTKNR